MRDQTPPQLTYSFRAECRHDFDVFVQRMVKEGIPFSIIEVNRGDSVPIPEPMVEIETAASLEQLRNLIRAIPDGHVMLQTLRPLMLAQNRCERDYTLV